MTAFPFHLEIVKDQADFQARFENEDERVAIVAAQPNEQHADIDMALVEQIEALLAPRLGHWEQNLDTWWHNIDYYGDGVRGLAARWDAFPWDLLPQLALLLCGPQKDFCILFNLYESMAADDGIWRGAIALYHERALVTESVAKALGSLDRPI